MSVLREAATQSKAWPFEEARRILKRFEKTPPKNGYALFETGYGPSGLPHIGTFGEVARTSMVIRAFQELSEIPTRLVCFSDDLAEAKSAMSDWLENTATRLAVTTASETLMQRLAAN